MYTLSERLKWARERQGLSQADLAKRSAVSQSTIGNLEAGTRLSARRLPQIADVLGVSPLWLAEGSGAVEISSLPSPASKPIYVRPIITYDSVDELPPETTVLITRIDVAFSTGDGRENWYIEEKEPLPFQTDYIKRLDVKPANLVAVKIKGNSMEPRLFDQDTILVDRRNTRIPANGGVFALVYAGEMLVKRLFPSPDGGVRVISDNKDYEPFSVAPEHLESVEVVGRVKYRSGAGDF